MMSKKEPTLGEGWDKLMRQRENGKPQPPVHPEALRLNTIKMWPGVFQHRGRRDAAGERHVDTLAKAARSTKRGTLEPVTVWWDGKAWACIDGHHRLDAYRSAAGGAERLIPVKVFNGELSAAMTQAASANTRDKLAMPGHTKTNTAWRLVAIDQLSKAEIMSATGVADGTVANMRRVLAKLKVRAGLTSDDFEAPTPADPRNLTWAEAKAQAEDRPGPERDQEEANEKRAQAMALDIRKAIGKEGGRYPQIMARALDIYDTRLMAAMYEWWKPDTEDETEKSQEAD